MRFAYPVEVVQDEAGYFTVTFPDVPEAMTDAADERQALVSAADALGVALAGYVHAGRALPSPSAAKGRPRVAVPGLVAAKLALCEAIRAEGITQTELARRLGKTENTVRRLLDPDHASRWENIEAALAVLGHQLIIEAA